MIAAIRWLLVVPAALLGWYIAFAFVAALHSLATHFCPLEALISGACVATWFPFAESLLSALFAGLAAGLVVLFPALVAPSHRPWIAWLAFICGLAVALYFALQLPVAPEFSVAAAVGLLVAIFIGKRHAPTVA